MKTLLYLVFFTSQVLGISTFSVSGKPTDSCLDSLYEIKLYNNSIRYHCSLQSIYEDKINYGINEKSIKKYNQTTKNFEHNDEFYNYTNKQYQTDVKNQQLINEKYNYPKGKKIYQTLCKNEKIDFEYILEISDLISYFSDNNICRALNNEYLYYVSNYLWGKNKNKYTENTKTLEVKDHEKCPVCGMFVYKYPKWVAQVFTKDMHLSFDGVKDMMKFYFEPSYWNAKYQDIKIEKIMVSDYYSMKAIDGKKSFYVIGSDVYGPMGKELIPFENENDAKAFLNEHRGKKIYKFDEINQDVIKQLD